MNPAFKQFFEDIGRATMKRSGSVATDYVRKLDELLITAGEPGGVTGTQFLGIQMSSMVVFPLVWSLIFIKITFFSFLVTGPKQVLVYAGLVVLGFFFPTFNLRERAEKRQKAIALHLPDTMDLLSISVEAGLDFMTAMRRVVEKGRPGPLKEELERFFKQTELGRPRRVALREMANRVGLADLRAVVSALIQADRLGAPLGQALKVQSDMLRTRRSQRAEKAAHEAPVKMLAPLMVCILPSVFLMILSPIFIQVWQQWNR